MALNRTAQWVIFWTSVLLLLAASLSSMGCVSTDDIERVEVGVEQTQDAVRGLNDYIEQLENNLEEQGKELPQELADAKEVASQITQVVNAFSSDLGKIKEVHAQGQDGLATALNIGSIFAGPYAPIITGIGALFGIGGVHQARKKNKEAVAAKTDLNSLATTLVRVADRGPNAGVIDTNDELTRARLDNMSAGATTAIRQAQGKKI